MSKGEKFVTINLENSHPAQKSSCDMVNDAPVADPNQNQKSVKSCDFSYLICILVYSIGNICYEKI